MPEKPQSFENHTRFDPLFHFVLAPASLLALGWFIMDVIREPGAATVRRMLAAAFAVALVFKVRLYALKVQDRVIRLEERVRLKQLLPPAMQPRIAELTDDQLIGLRFASDPELAELAEKAVAEKLNRKQIKQAIRRWRPDNVRV